MLLQRVAAQYEGDQDVNDLDLLLLLAISLLSACTFWCNYLRSEAGESLGHRAESGASVGYLTAAAALPIMCVLALTLAFQVPDIGEAGRVLMLAAILQCQWTLSQYLFSKCSSSHKL